MKLVAFMLIYFFLFKVDHCHLFPRPMGEIIQRHNVQELHLSLTKGIWRYNAWGYPVKSAPPGAEVWAWFKPNTTEYSYFIQNLFC